MDRFDHPGRHGLVILVLLVSMLSGACASDTSAPEDALPAATEEQSVTPEDAEAEDLVLPADSPLAAARDQLLARIVQLGADAEVPELADGHDFRTEPCAGGQEIRIDRFVVGGDSQATLDRLIAALPAEAIDQLTDEGAQATLPEGIIVVGRATQDRVLVVGATPCTPS